ncbi:hypothetical protein [Phenylobacterium sp. Root700]|nr:hypothetical protein [Phenylobacterium sp. Root700]
MTCTYPQSIELKAHHTADAVIRDVVVTIAVAVIFSPLAILALGAL